jgi:hypothetical protein
MIFLRPGLISQKCPEMAAPDVQLNRSFMGDMIYLFDDPEIRC